MNMTIELIMVIARIAHKTQETVKNISLYFEDSDDDYIRKLCILLDSIKTISIKSILENAFQTGDIDLEKSLHKIGNNIESIEKFYTVLKDLIPDSVPNNLKSTLCANITSLKRYYTDV